MKESNFDAAFAALTGNAPFPWQRNLYENWFVRGEFPDACTLPTGLGKTSVIAVWLIALVNGKSVPRRLVYVVNRRTVVDQTTDEVEKYKKNLAAAGITESLAVSTLRGQFADNRAWSADPSRPAVICGTVDMIGSRLLFSGYTVGFRAKPLHAGFLGQDVLLVHDEAHLEPAFQHLIVAIQNEQKRCNEFCTFRVMELTATSRGQGTVFKLTEADRSEVEVRKRINAKKSLHLHQNQHEKRLADEIAELALKHEGTGRTVLVFVRKVDDADKVARKLPKDRIKQLTGTLRGLERDRLVEHEIFRRFLRRVEAGNDTAYLVCTSAGEVGVNISADHMVCDLSTFDSMAQRFGRVNRFGDRDDTRIDIVHPQEFDDNDLGARLKKTLELLTRLTGDGSPAALGSLDPQTQQDAFAPPPTILPTSDILFDTWALTTIREKLPGRPPVEPYLHGISEWQPPETYVGWREEVGIINGTLLDQYDPEELLEDYPLKPHELLRDNSNRVFDRLKKLKAADDTPVWLVSDDGTVSVTTLATVIDAGKELIEHKTMLLPPAAGGLNESGIFTGESTSANDVADELFNADGNRKRIRLRDGDQKYEPKSRNMRLIRRIELSSDDGEDEGASQLWDWFERPADGDTDGSKSSRLPVALDVHVGDVVRIATDIVSRLPLSDDMRRTVILAAKFHDHGKRRKLFQTILGNGEYPNRVLAKSGKKGGRVPELYRHEFGSLVDLESEPEFRAIADDEQKDLIRHLIAVHHGRGRPHFQTDEAFDPDHSSTDAISAGVPRRFAKLQWKYGRWGLAYLESLLRAADYAASAAPSQIIEGES